MYKVNGTLNFNQLNKLTILKENKYTSKIGDDYIEGLESVFNLINRNDQPFTVEDISKQPLLNDFNFSGVNDFVHIAVLKARPLVLTINGNFLKRKNEKIEVISFVSKQAEKIFKKSMGVAYIITSIINEKEHIIKFGQTRTTFQKRLSSYNCGTVNNWRTASTTNIKMLQSMVTTRARFNLYIYDCSNEVDTYVWHGIESVPFASSKPLAVEDIMIKMFEAQFAIKPLANIQGNATTVD